MFIILYVSLWKVPGHQVDDVPGVGDLRALRLHQLLGAVLHLGAVGRGHRRGHRAALGLPGKLYHQVRLRRFMEGGRSTLDLQHTERALKVARWSHILYI